MVPDDISHAVRKAAALPENFFLSGRLQSRSECLPARPLYDENGSRR